MFSLDDSSRRRARTEWTRPEWTCPVHTSAREMADGPAGVALRSSLEAVVDSAGDDSGPIAAMYLFTVAKVKQVKGS